MGQRIYPGKYQSGRLRRFFGGGDIFNSIVKRIRRNRAMILEGRPLKGKELVNLKQFQSDGVEV